jgi:replication factor C subunit 2/4
MHFFFQFSSDSSFLTAFVYFWHAMAFSGYPCPPYKIIILDEADSMTEDAQVHYHMLQSYIVTVTVLNTIFASWWYPEFFPRMRWGVLWRHIPKWQDSSSYAIISAGIHQSVHVLFFMWYLIYWIYEPTIIVQYRIIEPLASRCAKFRFKPLSEDVMSNRILHICSEEGLTLDAQVTLQFSLQNIYVHQAYF